jgi:N-acetylglucosaminyldiphosphoundecaprenol N-acetyl-beta-D-mannosaminyltransferase
VTKHIISLFISTGSYDSFIHRIIELARKKQSSYVCVANVHMTIEAYWDSKFAEMVNDADLVTPDGMPLAKAMKLLYGIRQDRVAGMDLLPDLLKKAEEENLGVFFYGGTEEMLQRTQTYVQATYPNLKEQAYYSPPFRALTAEEEVSVIQQINNSGAHLVFVALGCPKQEKWMAGMKGKINACMLGIGGALPVMIGMQKRAPQWMQKLSLEWLYRLLQEPKRLFKRYFVTNTLFIWLLFKAFLSRTQTTNSR